jgi:hypothetical protein
MELWLYSDKLSIGHISGPLTKKTTLTTAAIIRSGWLFANEAWLYDLSRDNEECQEAGMWISFSSKLGIGYWSCAGGIGQLGFCFCLGIRSIVSHTCIVKKP